MKKQILVNIHKGVMIMMKKSTTILLLLFLTLGGIVYYYFSSTSQNEPQIASDVNLVSLEKTIKENEKLHQLLEQRPNLSTHDLRETLNLSFKIMNAMARKDYAYLKSISASTVTIDEDSNMFHFVSDIDHEQKFLQSVDFDKLEYRFHDMVDDIITVGFAYKSVEVYYEFVKSDTEPFYLLRSYVTN
jgi:hypothetical protein